MRLLARTQPLAHYPINRLPWDGDMDLRAYLGALRDEGFQGGLALDLYKQDYEGVARECVAYLRGLLAAL